MSGGDTRRKWRVIALSLTGVLLLTMISVRLVADQLSLQAARCERRPLRAVSIARAAATPDSHLIATENARPGTKDWMIPDGHAATVEIQGYAGAESAGAGQTLTFYVSTQFAGMPYTVEVYRLGWYGGLGGRLMATLHEQGQAQGYYDAQHIRLVGCASCTLDPQTHLVEANWRPSFTLTIEDAWTTGLYVAKLTDANDQQTYVSFEVCGQPESAYVVVVPDTTTAAYNDWGGYSLYHGPDGAFASRSTIVSFDRPALGWRFGYGNPRQATTIPPAMVAGQRWAGALAMATASHTRSTRSAGWSAAATTCRTSAAWIWTKTRANCSTTGHICRLVTTNTGPKRCVMA